MRALYAGSFNPPHLGHLDIIVRAASLFDHVTVAVLAQSAKKYALSGEERAEMLRRVTHDMPNVSVIWDDGLLVDVFRRTNSDVILRGVRGEADMTFESELADANHRLAGCETVFMPASADKCRLSSTIVRDCASHGVLPVGMVPEELKDEILHAFGAPTPGKGVF